MAIIKCPCFMAAVLLLISLFLPRASDAEIKRSRAEGLVEVRASNTEGFSNIWVNTDLSVKKVDDQVYFEPTVGGTIGIASLMHLNGKMGLPKGRTLGTTELHAQLTLPGNDNLRFIGFGASGDLLLTTIEDTAKKEPDFKPYLGFTAMLDIDAIKVLPWLPLKLYANITNLDDENLLLYFNAINLRGGLEYKGERHSVFASGRIGLYQENERAVKNGGAGGSYSNSLISVYPGVRYRIGNRMSVVARGELLIASVGNSKFLPKQMFGFSVLWEMPLYFKDTNAEAIRTLIFVDRKKKSIGKSAQDKVASGKNREILPGTALSVNSDTTTVRLLEDDFYQRKEDLKKHREKALEEMKKIEEMLE